MNNFVTTFLSVLVLVLIIFNWTGLPVLGNQTLKTEELILVTEDTLIPPPKAPSPPPPPPHDSDVFDGFAMEELPFLLICKDEKDRRKCSNDFMINFIKTHLEYPKSAKEALIEGTALVVFIIGKNGSMMDLKIVRDPGEGLGDEALRIIKLMADEGPVWMPGKQRNRLTSTRFHIPVKFKLNDDDK